MELSTTGVEIAFFALATCATPGPVNIVATISGARNGLKANLPFVLGATIGLSFVIIVSGFGVSQIIKTNDILRNTITLIGSGYILFLALLMFKNSITIDSTDGAQTTTNFYRGTILQVINPKAWLVSMSGLAMYLRSDGQSVLLLYIVLFFIACFVSVFLWVFLGRLVAANLSTTHLTIFTRLMAATLSLLVLSNLIGTFSP